MCKTCIRAPPLSFERATVFEPFDPPAYLARTRPDLLASFALSQWVQLCWPMPDAVVPMRGAEEWGRKFAEMVERPFAPLLKRDGCDIEAIEEDQVLLLLAPQTSLEEVGVAISLLEETLPRKGLLLSLFPLEETL